MTFYLLIPIEIMFLPLLLLPFLFKLVNIYNLPLATLANTLAARFVRIHFALPEVKRLSTLPLLVKETD